MTAVGSVSITETTLNITSYYSAPMTYRFLDSSQNVQTRTTTGGNFLLSLNSPVSIEKDGVLIFVGSMPASSQLDAYYYTSSGVMGRRIVTGNSPILYRPDSESEITIAYNGTNQPVKE